MRRVLFNIICVLGSVALLAGCDKPELDPLGDSALQLEKKEVDVVADGGRYTVGYELLNPVAGATIKVNVEHDWVKNVVVAEEQISFDVDANYDKLNRSCRIELIYQGIYPNPTITINQSGGKEYPINFNLISVATTTITLDVIPKDKKMPYVFILGNGTYIEENGLMTDDEALWQSDLEIFEQFAAAFGGDASLAAKAFMYEGDLMQHQITGLTPDTKYVVYAYGFDNETLTPLTEISRMEVKTAAVNDYILHFDFNVQVDGPNVSIDIEPINYDGYYYYGVFWAKDIEGISAETLRSYCEADWEQQKSIYAPFFESTEEGLHFIFNELAYRGPVHLDTELDSNTEFVLWAFGLNDEALLNTTPEIYYFTTGAPNASANELTLSVDNIHSRKVTINVETTNDDKYIVSLVPTSRFEGLSDDEVINYIISNFTLNYTSGDISDEVTGLKPSTEYELLAFGCQAGCATTGLERCVFTTSQVEYADLDFSLTIGNYYDGEEVAALNPNYSNFIGAAIVDVTVNADPDAVRYYFTALEASEFYKYDYEKLISGLTSEGEAEEKASYAFFFDTSYIFFGVAEDEDGNYTEVWASKEITFTYDGCSPAEEFLASTEDETPAKVMGAKAKVKKDRYLSYFDEKAY